MTAASRRLRRGRYHSGRQLTVTRPQLEGDPQQEGEDGVRCLKVAEPRVERADVLAHLVGSLKHRHLRPHGGRELVVGRAGRQQVDRAEFQRLSHDVQVPGGRAVVFQEQGGRLDARAGIWPGNDESAPRSAAHGGDGMVLKQAHRFAVHGPAHAEALEQLWLRADDSSHRQLEFGESRTDVARGQFGQLVLPLGGAGFKARRAATSPGLVVVLLDRLEVGIGELAGRFPVAGDDLGGEPAVVQASIWLVALARSALVIFDAVVP